MVNVLIADDNVFACVHLSNAINTDHVRCIGIETESTKVYQRVKDLQPEVLILDLKMPGKSGLEILDEIQKDHDLKTKVFIYSSEMEYMAKARNYKCVDRYYTKFTPAEQILKDIQESFDEISYKSTGDKVYKMLFELGFKYHLKGTRLMNECIVYSIVENEDNVKNIYKRIADNKGENAYTVKSDINKAIKIMWRDTDQTKVRRILRMGECDEPSAKGIISMAKYYINN